MLLDIDGNIRIGDFGLSKPEMDKIGLANSFCGSPEYMVLNIINKLTYK